MRVINDEVCGSGEVEIKWNFGNSKLFGLEIREGRKRKGKRKEKLN